MSPNETGGWHRPHRNTLRSITKITDEALLRGVLAAVVRIGEAINDEDLDLAREIAEGVELDIAAYLEYRGAA